MKLLEKALSHPSFSGWKISNVDLTIVAQQPKIARVCASDEDTHCEILGIPVDCVSVKGKTTEGMDSARRGEGIEAFASVLVYKNS
jgi:2-C-methyl-D-erythritol 2,4-cyclodiphosphate synthase